MQEVHLSRGKNSWGLGQLVHSSQDAKLFRALSVDQAHVKELNYGPWGEKEANKALQM